jgi:hypothetical protein
MPEGISVFEIGMLVCFGLSWPFAVLRTWRAKSAKGKSLAFLVLILTGYFSGAIHKIVHDFDRVIWLYIAIGCLVATDLGLTLRYRRLERAPASARNGLPSPDGGRPGVGGGAERG